MKDLKGAPVILGNGTISAPGIRKPVVTLVDLEIHRMELEEQATDKEVLGKRIDDARKANPKYDEEALIRFMWHTYPEIPMLVVHAAVRKYNKALERG